LGCQMVIDSNSDAIYGSYEVLSRLGPITGSSSMTQFQVYSRMVKIETQSLKNLI